MEPAVTVFDALKGFAKSSQDFVSGLVHRRDGNSSSSRNSPIEILKRLQREAFSDLMRLRDRQDKIEKLLTMYKTSNKGPFEESGTLVRGDVDVSGAILKMDNVDWQNSDVLGRTGVRTGVDSRLTFETQIRGNDFFAAEFMASQKSAGDLSDLSGNPPLSLAKVFYKANITDWFSAVAIPAGARCRDLGSDGGYTHKEKGLTDNSSFEPPSVWQQHGSAFGITARKANIMASLGQLAVALNPHVVRHIFGQIVFDFRKSKLSLVGIHQIPVTADHRSVKVGPFAISLHSSKRHQDSEVIEISTAGDLPGSMAVMLESRVDEDTRIGGWVEMKSLDKKNLKWGISVSDDSEEELGWGLSLSGATDCFSGMNRFQIESYMKLNLGKRFTVRPGLVHVIDNSSTITAFMVRSNWSFVN